VRLVAGGGSHATECARVTSATTSRYYGE
jgi:hypothetical protein